MVQTDAQLINPRRACTARVTVVVMCVSMCVLVYAFMCLPVSACSCTSEGIAQLYCMIMIHYQSYTLFSVLNLCIPLESYARAIAATIESIYIMLSVNLLAISLGSLVSKLKLCMKNIQYCTYKKLLLCFCQL